jgi:hypothetical protein
MKKLSIIKQLVAVLVLALTATSCSDWLDVNTDPNNPATMEPENILPVAQTSVGGRVGGDLAIVAGLWAQHWTQSNISSQYKTLDAYALVPGDYDGAWRELYAGGLNDLRLVKQGAADKGNWNLYLQATVLQTYGFQILADFFDKIPYTEALKGLDNLYPKFDDGTTVYDGLIADLNEALGKDFDATTNAYVKTDLVFPNGDVTSQIDNWKKFANTLKLKIYLRQTASSRSAAAMSAISQMFADGVQFLDTDASITQFVDAIDRSNFLYENNVRRLNVATNLRMSRTIQSFLEANDDTDREAAYFKAGSSGQYGLEQGDYEAPTTTTPGGKVSTVIITPLDPFFFMSYDESLFLQAEARLRMGEDISGLYDEAVSAAYAKFGLDVPAGILGAGGAYEYPAGGSFDDKLKALMTQKWLAMFKQSWEAFFDQERTGIPKKSPVRSVDNAYVPGELTYAINGVTSGAFPKRLLFPSASSDVNPNTPTGEKVTDKIWWMP